MPTTAPPLPGATSAQPIQRLPNWKKLLAGAGAVLGAGGLIAGGVLASPGLALAGGLGLLAGGGYLLKTERDRRRNEHRRQRELEEATQGIHRGIGDFEEDDDSRSAVLSRILAEASRHHRERNVRLATTRGRGELAFGTGSLRDRNYEVRVNPDEPIEGFGRDVAKTRSTVLHELTHVAVDQGYGVNAERGRGEFPENVRSDEDRNERDAENYRNVEELRRTLENDEHIPKHERGFIDSRLDYANSGPNTVQEHDTVMNELLYYFHLKGIPEHSETSRAITRLAHAAYRRRTN